MIAAVELSEWIGMATAVIGTVVSVASLVLQQRQRAAEDRTEEAQARIDDVDRWEAERVSRSVTADETRVAQSQASVRRAEAEEAYNRARRKEPSRRRWSYKAGASAVLGMLTLFGALGLLATAELTGEPVTTQDILSVLFYAAIAVILGLSARRDIKSEPGRRGIKMAWTGIVTAAAAGLSAVQAPTEPPQPPPQPLPRPNLVVVIFPDCTGYRVTNNGNVPAGAFQVIGTDSGGSSQFDHSGLAASGVEERRFFARGGPSFGPTTVQVDPLGAVAESNEEDNAGRRQCP